MLTRTLQEWQDDNCKLLIVFCYFNAVDLSAVDLSAVDLSAVDLSAVDLGAVGGPLRRTAHTRVLPQLPQLQYATRP
jgi:uncharacterized protein YjbI with pentapeptide repeats